MSNQSRFPTDERTVFRFGSEINGRILDHAGHWASCQTPSRITKSLDRYHAGLAPLSLWALKKERGWMSSLPGVTFRLRREESATARLDRRPPPSPRISRYNGAPGEKRLVSREVLIIRNDISLACEQNIFDMTMTIAAAQLESSRGDVAENLERHVQLIRLAAKHKVRALVFPELSLTGYEPDLADNLAFSERDRRLDPLSRAASNHGMVLVVGAPVRLSSGLHIGAFILYPDRPMSLYTKHHLGGEEPGIFQSCDRNPLVDLANATAAVAICADTNHHSHPRNAADRGASVYLASVLYPPPEFELATAKLKGYALEYSMSIVLANSGGSSSTLKSAGGSSVWSESGKMLARFEGLGTGIVMATKTESGWIGKVVVGGSNLQTIPESSRRGDPLSGRGFGKAQLLGRRLY